MNKRRKNEVNQNDTWDGISFLIRGKRSAELKPKKASKKEEIKRQHFKYANQTFKKITTNKEK